jgi:ABC-type branched-subunit amino acid transport system ATPase component
VINVRGLNLSYGKSHVVRGVSFHVARGSIVGLLGRNGMGKTTTLKGIMGLVPNRSGSVDLDGTDLSSLEGNRIARAGVGYVPQGRQLFPHLSVAENLKLAWHGTTKLDDATKRTFAHFPPLKALMDRYAGTLSGGEQQMVAIARAIINRPKAILFDEPSEGLSPLYVDGVRTVIDRLRTEGLAVVLVEQNLELATKLCDFIHFLEKGVIVASGSVEEASKRSLFDKFLGVGAK